MFHRFTELFARNTPVWIETRGRVSALFCHWYLAHGELKTKCETCISLDNKHSKGVQLPK